MPLSRHSKIKEVWNYPAGHDLLQNLLQQRGHSVGLLQNPLVGNLPLASLDRLGGEGFADLVVEMATGEAQAPRQAQAARPEWWKEAVIYQIYMPSFMDSNHDGVGDLGGVIQRLPYLVQLGVDTLWLWPLLDATGTGLRRIRDYYTVREDLGTLRDLEDLVDEAHAQNVRVVIGLEIGATSDQHPWFTQELERRQAGEEPGYYYICPGTPERPPNNWGRPGGASAWTWLPQLEAWGLNLGGRNRMDLNWDNPAVRAELAEVLRFWRGKGVDGFIFGAVNMISKETLADGNPVMARLNNFFGYEKFSNGPNLHAYLRELRAALGGEKKAGEDAGILLAGELRGAGTEMAKQFTTAGRGELDMILDYSHLTPKNRAPGEEGRLDLAALKAYYLRWMEQYGEDNWMTLFFETAETPRMVSRLGASPIYRNILAKLLGTLLFTLRGTPILYQGEELGLGNTRFNSADELRDTASLRMYADLCGALGEAAALQRVLRHAADHAHTPMPWSGGPEAGFSGAEPWIRLMDGAEFLNANLQMGDTGSVWNHYRRLIALRKSHECLIYGTFAPVFVKNKKVFCYFRIFEGAKWYVEINLTEQEVLRPGRIAANQHLELSNYGTAGKTLRPYEANLYRCD